MSDAEHGLLAEGCGDSGYRLVNMKDGVITKLSSARKILTSVCWYPDIVPAVKKRKRTDSSERPLELFGVENSLTAFDTEVAKKANRTPFGGASTVRFADGRTYFDRSGGLERGKAVHLEVEHFTRWPPKRFLAAHPSVDPLTKAVTCCITQQLNLQLIDAERIVFDVDLKSGGLSINGGTAVDFIGLDKSTGALVLIELKTGSDETFDLPCRLNPRMRPPYFNDVPNTPLNRARLQLLLGAMFMERCFGVTVSECYVVHAPASDKPAVAIPLGSLISKKEDLLRKAMEEWRMRV